MKKKVLLMIVMIVLVALMASVLLTGCTLFKLNNERQANDVLATVSVEHEGQTISLDVTRNELMSYVNYMINLYSAYSMSYDVEKLVTDGLDSLVNQKYLVLEGMIYLMGLEHRSAALYLNDPAYAAVYGNNWTPEGVLTKAERYAAIANTNKSFSSSIDQYIEDYETEQRNLLSSTAREKLASYYADGYKVADDGVAIYHLDGSEYKEGLYKTEILKSSASDAEVDYTKVYLKIKLVKTDAADKEVYLPISSTSMTTEDDSDASYQSNYLAGKICKVTYDEPVTSKDKETTYTTHTATANYVLVTPRTTYKGETEETEETSIEEGSVKFRYNAFSGDLSEELSKIVADGQFFNPSPASYASDAEKDAYRQFRESKKSLLIGYDPDDTDDYYNGLGYYYKNAFESAVLSAVQHELKRAALTTNPVSAQAIVDQYNVLVSKQAEEYGVLDNKAQIDKFAAAIGTDMTKAYYVPVQAMMAESFEIDPSEDTFSALFTYDVDHNVTDYNHDFVSFDGSKYTMHYAYQNADGTYTINMFYIAHILFKWTSDISNDMAKYITDRSDAEVKATKTQFVNDLKTNKSQLAFATAAEEGTEVSDAFFTDANGSLAYFSVIDAIAALDIDMNGATDGLEAFKNYMTYYNDDSGSMTSALGYFIAAGDISNSYDGSDFPNMAIKLYFDMIAADKTPGVDYEISDFAFTSYGLHIETISFAPFYHVALTDNSAFDISKPIDLNGTTFAETIRESLESDAESKAYSAWTKANGSEQAKDHVVKYDKKLKKMMKDLGL